MIMCGNTRPLPVRRFQTLQSVYERSSDARISTAKNGGFLIGARSSKQMRLGLKEGQVHAPPID